MADYIRRVAEPMLQDLDAETREIAIGALEIACESREFESDEVVDIFIESGFPEAEAERRCDELRAALGYGDDDDARPWLAYAIAAGGVVAAAACLLRLEDGRGIALIAEHYQTALMGIALIPVLNSLKGQRLNPH